jgi:hypothetical protein
VKDSAYSTELKKKDDAIAGIKADIEKIEKRMNSSTEDTRLRSEQTNVLFYTERVRDMFREVDEMILTYSESHTADEALAQELSNFISASRDLMFGHEQVMSAIDTLIEHCSRPASRAAAKTLRSKTLAMIQKQKAALLNCLNDSIPLPFSDRPGFWTCVIVKLLRTACYFAAAAMAESTLALMYKERKRAGSTTPPNAMWFTAYLVLFAAVFDTIVMGGLWFLSDRLSIPMNIFKDLAVDAAVGLLLIAVTSLWVASVVQDNMIFAYRETPERALQLLRLLAWLAVGLHGITPYAFLVGPDYMRIAQRNRRMLLVKANIGEQLSVDPRSSPVADGREPVIPVPPAAPAPPPAQARLPPAAAQAPVPAQVPQAGPAAAPRPQRGTPVLDQPGAGPAVNDGA